MSRVNLDKAGEVSVQPDEMMEKSGGMWARHKVRTQLIKYIALGNISNAIDFSGLYVLTEFAKIHYLISAAISFTMGVITAYAISIFWIFTRGRHKIHVEIFLIFIVSTVGLGLNELIILILSHYISIHYMIAKMIAATIVMFWNFFARRRWIFVRGA